MIRPAAAALMLLAAVPAMPQAGKAPELPKLMNVRSVSSLPAAKADTIIRYGEGESQFVELFLPKADAAAPDAPRPVVVLIHGGCWKKSVAGLELVRPAAAAFVEKGYAVWSITYRRIDEEGGGYPGTYQDVGAAIDLIREHAATHNLDPNKVALWGHSAGGHLALWAAGRTKLPAASPMKTDNPLIPRGVLSVGGFGSLADWEQQVGDVCGADVMPKMAPATRTADDGSSVDRTPEERFADTSPDKLLPTGVPTVMLHGVFDGVAFPAVGLSFAAQARKAGDKSDVQVAPVSGHFEVIAPGTPAFAQGVAVIDRMLR